MSGRKSFILKLNYLFHLRGGVQNPDNKINTGKLKKHIFLGVSHHSELMRKAFSMDPPAGEARGHSSPS